MGPRRPGLDNARAVHGRSQFAACFDGTDRFVIRSFVTADLGRSRHARSDDSRVIAGRFS
jgi:L-asparagine oxygenase